MPRLMSLVFGMRDGNGSIELVDRCRSKRYAQVDVFGVWHEGWQWEYRVS